MDGPTDGPMLPEAEAVYKGVLGDPAGLGPVAAVLVERTREARQPEAHVVALHAHAWAEHEAMRNQAARTLLDRALRVAERAGLPHRSGELLVSRAAVNQELGRLTAALNDLDRAATLVPTPQRPRLVLQRAVVDHNAGRLRPAAAGYQALLADAGTTGEIRAKAAINLAEVELARGRPQAAVPWADLALELAVEVGPVLVAYSAQTRARAYVQAGRPAQGLELFRQARGLHESAGLVVGEHLIEYADALSDLRLLPEALSAAREGAALLASDDASLMAAEAELRVARLELATGDTAAATQTAARAADRLRRQRRAPWVARAVLVAQQASGAPDPRVLRQVAGVLDDAGLVHDAVEAHLAAGRAAAARDDRAGAVRSLTLAAARARRAPLLVRLSGRLALAERAVLQGEPATSVVRSCRQGLDDLAAHRLALPSAELRALASGHGVELATVGLRALLPRASPARVLGWLELMRAAAIGGASTAQAPQGDHLARLRALHAELDEARSRAEPEPPALLAQVAQVEDTLRRAAWTVDGAVDLTRRVGLAELRERLQHRVLVEYAVLDGRLVAVVAGRRPVRTVDLGPVAPVEQATSLLHFGLRRLAVPGLPQDRARMVLDSARTATGRLTDLLVRPLGLDPGTPLVVAPVGALQLVPWPALHAAPVSVAPSASVWATTAEASDQAAEREMTAWCWWPVPDCPGRRTRWPAWPGCTRAPRCSPGTAPVRPTCSRPSPAHGWRTCRATAPSGPTARRSRRCRWPTARSPCTRSSRAERLRAASCWRRATPPSRPPTPVTSRSGSSARCSGTAPGRWWPAPCWYRTWPRYR